MSRNLSQTLFYEFYKSDPNFIYESVEEYRNYKSDPNFADKTIEQYRRVKALQKAEEASIRELTATEEVSSSDESGNECCVKNESTTSATTTTTLTEDEIETETVNDTEGEFENRIEGNVADEIEKEISDLKVEFKQSPDQSWNCDEAGCSINRNPSECSSDTLSRFTSETDLNASARHKKSKSKFRIPKTQSTMNFNNVKSRYMDVFKKK